jgi:hypothetical protein
MFDFVVTYLSVLKRVPLLAQLFDALLKINAFFFNRKILDFIDDIECEVLRWDNTYVHLHKFGGVQFNLKEKELGHIHGNGLLDVLFDQRTKKELLAEGKVKNHHTFKKSGWVSFQIKTEADKEFALRLLRNSYEAWNGKILLTSY